MYDEKKSLAMKAVVIYGTPVRFEDGESNVQTPYEDSVELPVDAVYGESKDSVEVKYTSMMNLNVSQVSHTKIAATLRM